MALFDTFDSDLDDIAARCADEDAGVRRVAVLELAEVTDERAVPLLVQGLRDADPTVREAAAKALDEHTGAGVVGALVDALEDPVAAVRLSAAETLAEKKDAASAALLIARVDHPAPFVRAAALRAVRELVTPDALPAALRALSDESPEVRREAWRSLPRSPACGRAGSASRWRRRSQASGCSRSHSPAPSPLRTTRASVTPPSGCSSPLQPPPLQPDRRQMSSRVAPVSGLQRVFSMRQVTSERRLL